MRLHSKLALVAMLPLLASLAVVVTVLLGQQRALIADQQALVRQAYLDTTETELRHYTVLALSAISPLYNTGRDDPAIQDIAMQRLATLDYGPDGYFFLYDYSGRNLMHPRQPDLVGKDLIDLRDGRGERFISQMIDKARAGGGFVSYEWQKPSTGQLAPKLAYVTGLDRWGWMIGTGVYTDDVDHVAAQLDRVIVQRVDTTMRVIAATAIAAIGLILVSMVALSFNELRAADAKLVLLARKLVRSQEAERAWLSRELHDGTSQTLVSVKLLTESALDRLPPGDTAARPMLGRAVARIEQALGDVRALSHRLRPAELDTLGLATALRHLGTEMAEAGGPRFEMRAGEAADALPDEIRTTLFRVTQEALANVVKHAHASRVTLALDDDAEGVRLTIEDDGRGFDPRAAADHPRGGIGLRNMRERLADIGGALRVTSRPHATVVVAEVPAAAVRRFATA